MAVAIMITITVAMVMVVQDTVMVALVTVMGALVMAALATVMVALVVILAMEHRLRLQLHRQHLRLASKAQFPELDKNRRPTGAGGFFMPGRYLLPAYLRETTGLTGFLRIYRNEWFNYLVATRMDTGLSIDFGASAQAVREVHNVQQALVNTEKSC